MKVIKEFKNRVLSFFLNLILIICLVSSCKEETNNSSVIPLSLITIAKEAEDQNKLNQCMGRVPGQFCITIVEHYPIHIRQIELLQNGNQIALVDATGVPITDAMCYVYYNIELGNGTPYRNAKIYLKNTDGEICGIGWEKNEGGTIDQLLNLIGEEKNLKTITKIDSMGMTLKFTH
ncbi:hypothetical protein EHQ75_01810 [Leptospira levettii]|uniref:Lipoprotein n=1 Tax=Leptospira levettii TaxID=2023178 RepID=A0AAW5VD92_9LEPT|nr:hypothetical protein [Leptospira levettii]MCW7464419.1 hypothetical protein [Leptospira levettii]MCW7495512.1 hypothetical protein [Leptospira levettii]MCW7511396.1 hypothetical protein [Leptospira levettii]MCW7515151.1 hypothetical protein [Leptospira levettii]TGM32574.1 hypothetical protein EHQ71_01755 [Leptospira levettii]